MKKTLLMLGIIAFCLSNGMSQSLPSWMVLRLSGGINLSKHVYSAGYFSGADHSTKKYLGYQGGIGVGLKVGEKFVLMFEPTFIQHGAKYENSNPLDVAEYFSTQIDILSLHMPVIGRFQLGDRWGLTAGFGFSPNISFSGKVNIQHLYAGENIETYDANLEFGKARGDFYDSFDFSLIIEPALFFNLNEEGTKRLTLGARWDLGMRQMNTSLQKQYWGVTGSEKQRSFMFNLGFELRPEW